MWFRWSFVILSVHIFFVPFLQCCGSGMINSGSGSSSEFSEFRFRNQIHNTAKIIKYRTCNLGLDLFCLFIFNFKKTTIEDFFQQCTIRVASLSSGSLWIYRYLCVAFCYVTIGIILHQDSQTINLQRKIL